MTEPTTPEPTGHPRIDEALERLARARRPRHRAASRRVRRDPRRAARVTRQRRARRGRPGHAVSRRLRLDAELVRRGLARSRDHAAHADRGGTGPGRRVGGDQVRHRRDDRSGHRGPREQRAVVCLPRRVQAARRARGVRAHGAHRRRAAVPRRRRVDRRLHRHPAAQGRPRGVRRRRGLRPAGLGAAVRRAGQGLRPDERPAPAARGHRRSGAAGRLGSVVHLPYRGDARTHAGVRAEPGRRHRADDQAAVRGGQEQPRQERRGPRSRCCMPMRCIASASRRTTSAGAPAPWRPARCPGRPATSSTSAGCAPTRPHPTSRPRATSWPLVR